MAGSTVMVVTGSISTVRAHSPLTLLPSSSLVAIIAQVPFLSPITTPFSSTVATEGSELLHVTHFTVASAGVSVAKTVVVLPTLIVFFSAVTVMPVTGFMFSSTTSSHVADTTLHPSRLCAIMVHVPSFFAVISPVFLSIGAIFPSVLDHFTCFVVASSGKTDAVMVNLSPTFKTFRLCDKEISLTATYPTTVQLATHSSCTPSFFAIVAVSLHSPSALRTSTTICFPSAASS